MKLYYILFLCSLGVLGCVDSSTDSSIERSGSDSNTINQSSRLDTETVRTLTALSEAVFSPNFESFLVESRNLETAVDQYCMSLGSPNEKDNQTAVQNNWRSAVSLWQRISAGQLGPITDNGDLLGGRIYSWPDQVSTCTLDRQVVLSQENDYQISTGPRQGRGLDALEYLLFNSSLNHSCSSLIPETQSWNTLSDEIKKFQRCSYAQLVAEDLSVNATALTQAWQVYQTNITDAGSENSIFETANSALNQVTDALFYLEKEVKDRKLAAVLGLNNTSGNCSKATCVELRESPWSENTLQDIQNNLVGFRQIFIASLNSQTRVIEDQLGFDYQLAIRNFPDLSETILNQTDEAINLIDRLPQSLNDYVVNIDSGGLKDQCINASNNRTFSTGVEVCALHGMIKVITDLLKTDFLTLMTLSLPERVEGDND